MMDYKELIEELKGFTYWLGQSGPESHDIHPSVCDKAVVAIETLLEERDAALEDLRGICWCCKHGKQWEQSGPLSKLTACEHLKECGVLACGGRSSKCPHWQWRGPKEGDAHEP